MIKVSQPIIGFWFPMEERNWGQIQQIARLGWTLNLRGGSKLSGGQGTLPSMSWRHCCLGAEWAMLRVPHGGTERRAMGLCGQHSAPLFSYKCSCLVPSTPTFALKSSQCYHVVTITTPISAFGRLRQQGGVTWPSSHNKTVAKPGFEHGHHLEGGFPGGSDGKESAWNVRDSSLHLSWEDPLEKEMATHSRLLASRVPWTEEPGGLVHEAAKSWTWLSY